jgi:acyl-CoA synthetase (AMP-forming)/AMP-acid ligase II/acetyltransferase-like isoleucine patch superfamily enzyme/acyl carrier protein
MKEMTVQANVEEMLEQHRDGRRDAGVARDVYQLLRSRARKDANAIAVLSPKQEPLTYGRLLDQTEGTVKALRAFGVRRNDPVALVLPSGPEAAVSFVAVASAATCAPLNPSYKADEFDFYLSDLKARALIVSSSFDSPVRAVAAKRGIPIIELTPGAEGHAGAFRLSGEQFASPAGGEYAEAGDIALVLHTSGTTSRPKIVPLSHENICASGRNVSATIALTKSDRCVNVMPLFHIHGLIAAVLSSLTAGASIVCVPGFDPGQFFGWLDTFKPSWYTAVPTIHQAILARASENQHIIAGCPLRLIRSSSASLPKPLMEDLERVFQTQVIEAYGMTEAAHQMTSNPLSPRPRKAGSVGVAAGPSVAVMNDAGELLPAGEIGEVVISGRNVTSGYANNPDANEKAFTNGWFRTGDQGRMDEEGYLFLTGRLKEIINRGGEKISPREVDDVLAEHPAIAQAVTFAVPHPSLGEEVAAAVVLKANASATESAIKEFAAAKLAAFKIPKQIVVLDQIPKGPTGKVQRIGLAEKLADKLAAKQEENFVAPQTAIEVQIGEIWSRLLKVERVGTRDDFNALGGDSLSMMMMLREVGDRFQSEVSVSRFLEAPTVETIARLLQEQPEAPSKPADSAQASNAPLIRDSILAGLRNRVFQYLALYAPGYKSTRVWLHRMRGVSIGNNVSIGLSSIIETAYPRLVSIGDNESIGMRTLIIGHLRDSTVQARQMNRATVQIEDDAYIGPGVIILPNVTIGRGAVVSAGSVVSRSIPPGMLARGNPAKPIARCGKSLGGGISYEEFIRHLEPLDDRKET